MGGLEFRCQGVGSKLPGFGAWDSGLNPKPLTLWAPGLDNLLRASRVGPKVWSLAFRDYLDLTPFVGYLTLSLVSSMSIICNNSRGRRWDPAEGIGILQNCANLLKMSIGKYGCVILLNSA